VNAILPGATASEGVNGFVDQLAAHQGVDRAAVEQQFFKSLRPTSLLQRFATPGEVAALVTFIASPVSAATNGTALRVDRGVVRSII
jgi:NAD(P)-dependent dehydrogenase (short-subunit alcohol dehydrogenase family)